MLSLLAALLVAGCSGDTPKPHYRTPTAESKRVLVVYNTSDPDSRAIADYYAERRRIPESNMVGVDCTTSEDVTESEFHSKIERPIRANIHSNANEIDFILLIRGIPIRLDDSQHYSVDAWIAAADLSITPINQLTQDALAKCVNPYFGADEPFTSRKFGFYLVTRLDGYTVEDCKSLVDHSLTAKKDTGPFLLDEADNRRSGSYRTTQEGLDQAAKVLRQKGYDVLLDTTARFLSPSDRLMGYASWGSNDQAFDLNAYRRLRFKPGALCETFVSTSGRTFRPTLGGQSLIADLIAGGVTGVKGYVSEPFTFALAKPDILFDRYTNGRNLAESFYAASEFLKWKDVVIGDPLCCPYRR